MSEYELRTSMMDFEDFNLLFSEELVKIPQLFKKGIAQFIVEECEIRHSKYLLGLYTLGHYMPRGQMRQPVVVLYFGSFKKAFPHLLFDDLRKEIAKTIAHELLHHWELKSGIDKLGDEDRKQLALWKQQTGFKNNDAVGRNIIEMVLFVYVVFVMIAVLARWITY